jgi:hypothetical protein
MPHCEIKFYGGKDMQQTQKRVHHAEDGYRLLANAIVLQAAVDYRRILRRLVRHPNNHIILSEKQALERFFRSEWYDLLTNVDPELLLARLNEEVAKG